MTILRSLFNQPYLLLTLTSLFWAGNAIVGRAVAGDFPPALLAQLRWIGASLIVLPFAWPYLKRDWPAIRRHRVMLVFLSLTGISAFNTLQYWSLNHTTATNVLLLQAVMPLMIAVAAFAVNRERLGAAQATGLTVSLMGVMVIVSNGDLDALLHFRINPGDAAFLLALAIYAVYSAFLKRRPAIHWLSFLAVTMGCGALLLLPVTGLELASGARPDLTAGNGAALLYIMIFPSLIAYLCFNRGVELIGANRTGPFFHLVPLFGVILAFLFLDERLTLAHLAGAALIGVGVLLASAPGRKPAPTPEPDGNPRKTPGSGCSEGTRP